MTTAASAMNTDDNTSQLLTTPNEVPRQEVTSKPRESHPIPPIFLDPLTHQVMREPLLDHDGHNFDRLSITSWMRGGHEVCPISHKPLLPSDLIPNETLGETIRRWVAAEKQTKDRSNDSIALDDDSNECTYHRLGEEDRHRTEQDDQDFNPFHSDKESAELGDAIASLSVVLSAKEGYIVVECDDDSNDDGVPEEEFLQASCLPQDAVSSSLLLNMFLPQEREALARVRARVRGREAAESWANLVLWTIIGTAVMIVVVLSVLIYLKITVSNPGDR